MQESISARRGPLDRVRVALFDATGRCENGLEELTAILDSTDECSWHLVSSSEIRSGVLSQHDVVVVPGGRARRQAEALGSQGREAVREFVRDGGGYVGICGGAFLASVNYDLGLLNAEALTGDFDVPGQGVQSMAARGVGSVEVELTALGRRLFAGFPQCFSVDYTGGPIISRGSQRDLPDYAVLAEYRSEVWQWEQQRGTMINTPAIIAARCGSGCIVLFSAHPEMTAATRSLFAAAVLATRPRRLGK